MACPSSGSGGVRRIRHAQGGGARRSTGAGEADVHVTASVGGLCDASRVPGDLGATRRGASDGLPPPVPSARAPPTAASGAGRNPRLPVAVESGLSHDGIDARRGCCGGFLRRDGPPRISPASPSSHSPRPPGPRSPLRQRVRRRRSAQGVGGRRRGRGGVDPRRSSCLPRAGRSALGLPARVDRVPGDAGRRSYGRSVGARESERRQPDQPTCRCGARAAAPSPDPGEIQDTRAQGG